VLLLEIKDWNGTLPPINGDQWACKTVGGRGPLRPLIAVSMKAKEGQGRFLRNSIPGFSKVYCSDSRVVSHRLSYESTGLSAAEAEPRFGTASKKAGIDRKNPAPQRRRFLQAKPPFQLKKVPHISRTDFETAFNAANAKMFWGPMEASLGTVIGWSKRTSWFHPTQSFGENNRGWRRVRDPPIQKALLACMGPLISCLPA